MKKKLLILSLLSFSFVNAQLENGMVAHFPFNGDFNDISTSAIVATNTGATFGPDRNLDPNFALALNENQYVSFNSNEVKSDLPLTISVWAKFDSFNESNFIFSSDQVYGNYWGYWFHTTPTTGNVAINYGAGLGGVSSNNRRSFVTNLQLSTGVWYHIVAIIRSYDDMSIYVDCNPENGVYSGTGSTSIAYSNSDSRFGSSLGQPSQPAGWSCKGSLDQLAIWDRALNANEITSLCRSKSTLGVEELEKAPRELVKIVNVLGQEVKATPNTPLIYIYSDGSTEKIVIVE